MQLSIARTKIHNRMWTPAALALALAACCGFLAFMVTTAAATTVTFVVDDDGQATSGNCNSSTVTPYTTVGSAVAAASAGDTVKVCPGAYAENVVVDKTLNLKGAKAGVGVASRTFGGANESTVTGLVTIQAAGVSVDGFSLTNPDQGLGVIVKTAGNNALIKKNLISTVGSATFVGPTVGVYLGLGPDGVRVDGNKITDVQSQTGSAQGILVGDSTSSNPSLGVRISGNTISGMASVAKGAYGVQINNGASTAPAAIGYTEARITGNTISNLSGGWAHAVGLEGETPNVVVKYNVITNLTDVTPTPVNDAIAVFFEANPFFFTSEVNHNSLAVGSTAYGIAVHPSLTAVYSSLQMEAQCNWWGASNGPGSVGVGSGSMVTAGVDYAPWLKSANLNKNCNHDDDHHHDWNKHDD